MRHFSHAHRTTHSTTSINKPHIWLRRWQQFSVTNYHHHTPKRPTIRKCVTTLCRTNARTCFFLLRNNHRCGQCHKQPTATCCRLGYGIRNGWLQFLRHARFRLDRTLGMPPHYFSHYMAAAALSETGSGGCVSLRACVLCSCSCYRVICVR